MKLKTLFLAIPMACLMLVPALAQESGSGAKAGSGTKTQTESTAESGSDAKTDGEEKEKPPLAFSVADGNLMFEATGEWKIVKPASRMLEKEIQVPKTGEDTDDGRLTIMGAGGSIEANVQRWEGQFGQADGSATEAKTEEITVEEMKVTMVDVAGSFTKTMGGPFSGGKKVTHPDYRMLAAIVETAKNGNYFVKLVGPAATIETNKEAFEKMIKSVKLKE